MVSGTSVYDSYILKPLDFSHFWSKEACSFFRDVFLTLGYLSSTTNPIVIGWKLPVLLKLLVENSGLLGFVATHPQCSMNE
jgi:hypothetical protein